MALKMMDDRQDKLVKEAMNNAVDEKSEQDKLTVGYFIYNNRSEADKAKAEQERIMKLEKQIDYDNPKMVHTLYNKIVAGDYFHTPEGLLYLVHLQDYLYSKEGIMTEPIAPIPGDYTKEKNKKTVDQLEEERTKLLDKVRSLESDKSKGYRNLKIRQRRTDNLVYKIVILGLIIVVVVMFIIAGASSSPNIINYRNKIQNEYSEWEKQLNDREKEIRAREQALDNDFNDADTIDTN